MSSLKPTQSKIDPKMLKKVLKGIAKGDKFAPVPVHKGNIIDGHHRVAGHKMMGKKVATKQASKDEMLAALKKKAAVSKGMSVAKM